MALAQARVSITLGVYKKSWDASPHGTSVTGLSKFWFPNICAQRKPGLPCAVFCIAGTPLFVMRPGMLWTWAAGQGAPTYRVGCHSLSRHSELVQGHGYIQLMLFARLTRGRCCRCAGMYACLCTYAAAQNKIFVSLR